MILIVNKKWIIWLYNIKVDFGLLLGNAAHKMGGQKILNEKKWK